MFGHFSKALLGKLGMPANQGGLVSYSPSEKKALKERGAYHASWHRDSLSLPCKKVRTGGTRQQSG